MKILTINTHSLQEKNYPCKLDSFLSAVIRVRPDLIAMQEVNQSVKASPLDTFRLRGFVPAPDENSIPIREDNHAAAVAGRLSEAGIPVSWSWLPVKIGYEKYDEGIAVLSLTRPICRSDAFCISRVNDYSNWRTRKVLGVMLEGQDDWFYTVHMGWWDDLEEPFAYQWERLNQGLADKRLSARVWMMGDFNAPSDIRGESYDCIDRSGWYDTYAAADERDDGITVPGIIDGWRDKLPAGASGMRLDYIWCSREPQISYSSVIFNGKNEPIVSDHFGVLIETKGEI